MINYRLLVVPNDIFKCLIVFLTVMITGVISVPHALSQVINVPAGDTGALIDAINAANVALDPAVINLGGGTYVLTVIDNSNDGDNGLPTIFTDMTFNGNGSIIERSPFAPPFRIFNIGGGQGATPTVTFNNLTIRNGVSTSIGGGGINNSSDGTVNINDCIVADNTCENGQAAGLNNDLFGTMNVFRTTVTRNINPTNGSGVGGVMNDFGGVLNITESTISDNVGPRGGGVGNNASAGIVNILNTTISGNRATRDNSTSSGGVYNNSGGTINIDSSTITGNEGPVSCNIALNSGGPTFVINTIVGECFVGPSCFVNSDGLIISEGYNIDQGSSCGFNSVGDKSNTNPLIGPLQNNGGPTDTHALLETSPALDMGNVDCPPPDTDQRGIPRPQGNRCDIGAFEFGEANIPTLSEWGILAMAGVLGIIGLLTLRRRKATA